MTSMTAKKHTRQSNPMRTHKLALWTDTAVGMSTGTEAGTTGTDGMAGTAAMGTAAMGTAGTAAGIAATGTGAAAGSLSLMTGSSWLML